MEFNEAQSLLKGKKIETYKALSRKVAAVLDVQEGDLLIDEPQETPIEGEKTKTGDLDHLVFLMKEKLKASNRQEKFRYSH